MVCQMVIDRVAGHVRRFCRFFHGRILSTEFVQPDQAFNAVMRFIVGSGGGN